MSKTRMPLNILCVGVWGDEFEKLREQGHNIHREDQPLDDYISLLGYDLILGPTCWRLVPEHLKYLSLALKEARAAISKKVKRAQD